MKPRYLLYSLAVLLITSALLTLVAESENMARANNARINSMIEVGQ